MEKKSLEAEKTKEYLYIQEELRRKKYGIDENGNAKINTLAEDLKDAVDKLSRDLYSKETHFVFELIQNAEDNEYKKNIKPELKFILLKNDPTTTENSNGALLITNNEIGFSERNIYAICSVGKSTKTKAQGYIGEKGIGFKSVFKITSCPYIFSNGYQIRLPRDEKITKLGYIVPEWVERKPKNLNYNETVIILPLTEKKYGYDKVEQLLKDIKPETILFLNKIKKLTIKTDSGVNFDISKNEALYPLVTLKSLDNEDQYLIHKEEINRPDGIIEEKRIDINSREITIACPLNYNQSKLFAFLPVHELTSFPFTINADFLLTSSRESIDKGSEWNIWLRDSIPHVLAEALDSWKDIEEYREVIFKYIPIECDDEFFEPILKIIWDELKNKQIIPTEPDGKLRKPLEVRCESDTKYSIYEILKGYDYPETFIENRLVLEVINTKYKAQLKKIGVVPLNQNEIIRCFSENEWIRKHGLDWFVSCYKYLSNIDFKESLLGCQIIPIETIDGVKCVKNYSNNIYFEENEEAKTCIKDLKKNGIRAEIFFLDKYIYSKIKDDIKLCSWLTSNLEIYYFIRKNYAIDVLKEYIRTFERMSEKRIISNIIFLSDFEWEKDDIEDMPILLENGKRTLLYTIINEDKQLVTPLNYDIETGWQNIFVSEQDRKNFAILSEIYNLQDRTMSEKIFLLLGVVKYPRCQISEHRTILGTAYEKEAFYKIFQRDHDREFNRLIMPDGLKVINIKTSNSLINWLCENDNYDHTESTIIVYREDGRKKWTTVEKIPSELSEFLVKAAWLPTTKGFSIACETFLGNNSNREVLGDFVPFYEGSPDIAALLGVNTEATKEIMLELLKYYSKNRKGTKEFAEKIYGEFLHREYELSPEFKENKLIFTQNKKLQPKWISSSEAIWKDRKDIFGEEFYYLESEYSAKIKEYFTAYAGVDEDASSEKYALYWTKLQESTTYKPTEIERKLRVIYPVILDYYLNEESDKKADWWIKFLLNARIWTKSKTFVSTDEVYVADDGELESIFQGKLNFAWQHEPYYKCKDFFIMLDVQCISNSAQISFDGNTEYEIKDVPDYLTREAKILILTYIKMEHPEDYDYLRSEDKIEKFLNTNEATGNGWEVTYEAGDTFVYVKKNIVWYEEKAVLLVTDSVKKAEIAGMLAKDLTRPMTTTYKKISDIIELFLGLEEYEERIERKATWEIPEEVKLWMDKKEENAEDNSTVDSQSDDDYNKNDEEDEVEKDNDNSNEDFDTSEKDTDEEIELEKRSNDRTTGAEGTIPLKDFIDSQKRDKKELSNSNRTSNKNDQPGKKLNKGTRQLVSYVSSGEKEKSDEQANPEKYRHNLSVEDKARKNVVSFEKKQGRAAEEMPQTNEGFDILSSDSETGEVVRYIEIKSLSGAWDNTSVAQLSSTQMEMARVEGDKYWLYIVELVENEKYMKIHRIQNPAEKITKYAFDKGWQSVEEQDNQISEFKVGSKINHDIHGSGVITEVIPKGESRLLRVNFNGDVKLIPLNLSNMEVIEE